MTVAELIIRLLAMPQDFVVTAKGEDGDLYDVYIGPRLHEKVHDTGRGEYLFCASSMCGLCAKPKDYPVVSVVEIE